MRRAICITEPSVALAGQVSTWKFSYTSSIQLAKGAKLKFDLMMQNRPTDWEMPETGDKSGENQIWLELPSGKTVTPIELEIPTTYAPAYEFTLPEEVKGGEALTIYLGSKHPGPESGNRAQTVTQRRRPFHLYVDSKGKGDYKDPEVFSIDIRGNRLESIQIITPSLIAKNRRFDIVVRFEDAFGNLTSNAPEGTLIELSYEFLRENLNWKLFVPETGFIVLPNLYFNEPGTYRIQLQSSSSDKIFYSSPIKCFADTDFSIYWGKLHGESQKIDSGEGIEMFLRHIRDEKGYQFIATSPFESLEETRSETWKKVCAHVQEYNEDGRFTALLGLQWLGDENEGLRQLIYWKDNKPMMRKKEAKYTNLKKITKIHSPKEVLSIPCFTMAKGIETDFSDFHPDSERVVEIYNAWGSSECLEKEGNPRPIKSPSGKGYQESAKGSLRHALNQNHRFGFVAGGLDDRGVYEGLCEGDQIQYSPGLTAIVAIEQARDTLMQALYNRSCYATTGAKIVMGFYIAGSPMGTELSTKAKPGLSFNRHLTGYICAAAPIKEVTLLRNGKELHTFHPEGANFEFEHDDFDPLEKIALPSPDEQHPFTYYYMRVVQKDGHIAWSSPIWVDLSESLSLPAKKGKSGPKK